MVKLSQGKSLKNKLKFKKVKATFEWLFFVSPINFRGNPIQTIGDPMNFLGEPTKTIGMPINFRG